MFDQVNKLTVHVSAGHMGPRVSGTVSLTGGAHASGLVKEKERGKRAAGLKEIGSARSGPTGSARCVVCGPAQLGPDQLAAIWAAGDGGPRLPLFFFFSLFFFSLPSLADTPVPLVGASSSSD